MSKVRVIYYESDDSGVIEVDGKVVYTAQGGIEPEPAMALAKALGAEAEEVICE